MKKLTTALAWYFLSCLCENVCIATSREPTPTTTIPGGDYRRGRDLGPSKRIIIKLKAYKIENDEVTEAQYARCVAARICQPPAFSSGLTDPVRGISWFDASRYCQFIGRRLPTEAEWERAAFPPDDRSSGFGPAIPSDRELCDVLSIGGEREGDICNDTATKPDPIASVQLEKGDEVFDRAAHDDGTVFGLFGNVAEWVFDWHESGEHFFTHSYFAPPIRDNPSGPPDGEEKVIRGGSYMAIGGISMSSRRYAIPSQRFPDVGVRCAVDVPSVDSSTATMKVVLDLGVPRQEDVATNTPTENSRNNVNPLYYVGAGLITAILFLVAIMSRQRRNRSN